MKQRIYIDTSVISGCFDIEFEEWSNRLFEDLKNGYSNLEIRTPREILKFDDNE